MSELVINDISGMVHPNDYPLSRDHSQRLKAIQPTNPRCCSSQKVSDRCPKCQKEALARNQDEDDEDEVCDPDSPDFDPEECDEVENRKTTNNQGAYPMLRENGLPVFNSPQWDVDKPDEIFPVRAEPSVHFNYPLSAQEIIANAEKAQGSNADAQGDAGEIRRAGRGGKVPASEQGGYWSPINRTAKADEQGDLDMEFVSDENRLRLKLEGPEQYAKPALFADSLPSGDGRGLATVGSQSQDESTPTADDHQAEKSGPDELAEKAAKKKRGTKK
jgi:hypothetical protein